MNMVGELLWVCVHFVFRFCLWMNQQMAQDGVSSTADRDDVHVEISLAALFLAPLCEFRVPGWDEAESFGRI
jgi:hypothetical protein